MEFSGMMVFSIDYQIGTQIKIFILGQKFIHESILGTKFEGKLLSEGPKIGPPYDSVTVVPQISGQAFITGFNQVQNKQSLLSFHSLKIVTYFLLILSSLCSL
jgi:hypothetical protein